jgi:hypothetical protein
VPANLSTHFAQQSISLLQNCIATYFRDFTKLHYCTNW